MKNLKKKINILASPRSKKTVVSKLVRDGKWIKANQDTAHGTNTLFLRINTKYILYFLFQNPIPIPNRVLKSPSKNVTDTSITRGKVVCWFCRPVQQ
jgi:hypothetical protein